MKNANENKNQKLNEFIREFGTDGFVTRGWWCKDAGQWLPSPPIQHVTRWPAVSAEKRKADKIRQLQKDLSNPGIFWKKGAKERAAKLLEKMLAEI